MAAISDSNFIVMSYSQDIKNPSKKFFTVLAKKPEILDAAVEDNISKKSSFTKYSGDSTRQLRRSGVFI